MRKTLFGSRRRLIFDAVVIVSITLLAGLVFLYFTHNFARDEAMPIEKELLAAGAVKVCERGDAGRGPSVQRPSYKALYTIGANATETENIIKSTTSKKGFSLVTSFDGYSSERLSDETSKKSSYPGFTNGNIKLYAKTYPNQMYAGPDSFCTLKEKRQTSTETTFGITIVLPDAN